MKVKICGMTRQQDLDVAARCGVDLCGFIFAVKSPRRIEPQAAAALDSHGMTRVGVATESDPEKLAPLLNGARLDLLQLHGNQSIECIRALNLPPEKLVRVFWPARHATVVDLQREMDRFAPLVGLFLLDAGTSSGGSGQRIALESLSGLHIPRPWLLAGGLNADNVAGAVIACRELGSGIGGTSGGPAKNLYGVDLNSGLEERPGCKDPVLVERALRALKTLPAA